MKLLLFGSGLLLALLGSLLGFLAGNGNYPLDPTGTLKRVQHGTLRVGYTQAPPWVAVQRRAAENRASVGSHTGPRPWDAR
jgi:hypothetical protein